jgi:hypothetical protein
MLLCSGYLLGFFSGFDLPTTRLDNYLSRVVLPFFSWITEFFKSALALDAEGAKDFDPRF